MDSPRHKAAKVLRDAGWSVELIAEAISRKPDFVRRIFEREKRASDYHNDLSLPGDLDDLWFSARGRTLIKKSGISSVSELKKRLPEIEKQKGVGPKTVQDILDALSEGRL